MTYLVSTLQEIEFGNSIYPIEMSLKSFFGAFQLLDTGIECIVNSIVLSPHLVGAGSDARVDCASQVR